MNRNQCARRSAFVGLILVGGVVISGCNVKFGKEGSTPAAGAADTQSVQLTAEQAQARTDCVAPEKQKDFTPSATPQETDKVLLDACKATGKTVFNGLPDASKGKAEVGSSPANAAVALEGTTSLHDATYDVRLLKVAAQVAASGKISDTLETADQLRALLPNANQQDVNMGTKGSSPVVLTANRNTQSGPNDFHVDQFMSTAEIKAFFASGTPQANAAKESVTKAIKDAGLSDQEVARALDGSGYIPLQLKDVSQVLGTTYFKDGKVNVLGQWRQAQEGDVYWLFVSSDGKLVPGALLRGKCANPGAQAIRIVKPGIPPAPSVTQPPGQETCPPGTVLTKTGECLPPSTPGCKVSCVPTTPPPGCKTSCTPTTLEQKNPNQIPGSGGQGDGGKTKYGGTGGQKMTAEPTAAPPKAGPPPATYVPPSQPVRTTAPPAGSHPTTVQSTPPPQGSQPSGGSGNTGVPTPPPDW